MKYKLSEIRKTVIATVPFILAAAKVVSDALGDGTVTTQEWVTALVAGLATVGVFGIKNVRPAGLPARPGVSEADGPGASGAVV